jgi:hypothetical protein
MMDWSQSCDVNDESADRERAAACEIISCNQHLNKITFLAISILTKLHFLQSAF